MMDSSSGLVRVAIYARVSSDQQAQDGTIASQIAALREQVAQDGHTLDDELCFVDDGVSGSTLMRPALERLRDVAYVSGFQKLYVHSPDRLARRYAYQVLLVDELRKHDVEVVFLNRPIGVSPEEDLLLQMQGMFAEYERAKIMERSRRGKRHAASRGCVSVLSGAPYGYHYIGKRGDSEASYEIHEPQAAVVRQMFEWVGLDRLSIGEVTRRLTAQAIPTATSKSRWDRTTVWGMLKNPAYRGSAAFGKTRSGPRRRQLRTPRGAPRTPRLTFSKYDTDPSEQISIPVPAIVSEELFAAVQEQLTENRSRSHQRKRGARYLLQGLVKCQCCDYAYYGKKVSRSSSPKGRAPYAYYRCTGTDAHRFDGKRVCDNKQVRVDKLDEAVWRDVCELLRHPQLLRKEYERRLAAPRDSAGEAALKRQISSAKGTVNRLIDAYADGVLTRDEFEPRVQRVRKRLADLEVKLDELQTQTREQTALQEALTCLDDFSDAIHANLDQADWTTRREILCTLIDHILIEPDQVRIVYRINFPLFAKQASNATKEKVLHFCWRRDASSFG